jgi:hypothetical protein
MTPQPIAEPAGGPSSARVETCTRVGSGSRARTWSGGGGGTTTAPSPTRPPTHHPSTT